MRYEKLCKLLEVYMLNLIILSYKSIVIPFKIVNILINLKQNES